MEERVRFTLGAALVACALVGTAFLLGRRGAVENGAARDSIELSVRTEPAGLPVTLDGRPIESGPIRVALAGASGELAARWKCRSAVRRIDRSDALGEVVLVLDPVEVEIPAGPSLPGASISWNERPAVPSPASIRLDLCQENRIEASARGHRSQRVVLPAGSTPLQARSALIGMELSRLRSGRILLPEAPASVALLVDGRQVRRRGGSVTVEEGRHEVRALAERIGIDVRTEVDVPPNGEVLAELAFPAVASVEVQAFPSNCKVYVKPSGGTGWRYMDDTPATLRLVAGVYRVRVRFDADGTEQEREVRLAPGQNLPLRFARGGGR